MARTADSVAVDVEVRLDGASAAAAEAQLDNSVNHMAASAGKAEAAITSAHAKIGIAANSARSAQMELMHVVRGSMDQFASGAPATQILAQHVASIGEAAELASGSMGAFGAFLASGWGIAIVVAGSALLSLVGKLHQTKDGVEALSEKMAEHALKAQASAEAADIFSHTLDGLVDHLNALTEALRKANDEGKSSAQLMLEDAKNTLTNLKVKQLFAQGILDIAAAQNEANRKGAEAAGPNTEEGLGYAALADASEKRVTRLQEGMARTTAAIAKAEKDLADAGSRFAVEQGKIDADPVASIKRQYEAADGLIETARRRALAEGKTKEEIEKQTKALAEQEKAAIKVAEARDRKPKGLGYSGHEVSFDEAAAIARGAGLQVNSSQRTYAQQKALYDDWVAKGRPSDNPVAAPGTSAHEGAKGRWALDIQLGPGVTADRIKKIYGDEGVDVKVFPEKGHLHVSGSRSEAAAADSAAERERRAAAVAAEKAQRQQDTFDSEMGKLQHQLIAAQVGRVTSADQQLQIDEQAIRDARDEADAGFVRAEAEHRIGVGKAALLKAVNDQVAAAKIQNLEAEHARQQGSVTRGLMENQQGVLIDQLKFEMDNAKTGDERRALALRLLQAEENLEKIKLQEVIDNTVIGTVAHNNAVAALAALPGDQARKAYGINHDPKNMSPGHQFYQEINQDVGQIHDSLEQVAVDGLKRLNDGLTAAIMGTGTLTDAFRSMAADIISQLIRIAITQAIIKPLAQLLGFGGGGTNWGSLFDQANAGDLPLTGMATGGPVAGGQPYMVGENGPELFIPNSSGMIVPNNDAVRTPSMGGGTSQIVLHVVRGEMFEPTVQAISGSVAIQIVSASAPKVTDMGTAKTFNKLSRPRL